MPGWWGGAPRNGPQSDGRSFGSDAMSFPLSPCSIPPLPPLPAVTLTEHRAWTLDPPLESHQSCSPIKLQLLRIVLGEISPLRPTLPSPAGHPWPLGMWEEDCPGIAKPIFSLLDRSRAELNAANKLTICKM